MKSRIKPRKRLRLCEEEKRIVEKFLVHRLEGVEQAIATLSSGRRKDALDWAAMDLWYYTRIRKYLVQCLYQIGKPITLPDARKGPQNGKPDRHAV